jgi:hypothetical protein
MTSAPITSWWTREVSPRQAYAIAAALGLAVYVAMFGPGHMFGTTTYWDMPQPDQRAYLIGFRYFLHEPWHWPLFTSKTMNLPYRESIAFTDSIPLWAFVNKLIATVVPPWKPFAMRAYLGIWAAIVYTLQACFGVGILRQLGHCARGAAIVTSVFFIAIPAFVIRYGHASLSAHFLTLSAFYLYLRCSAAPAERRKLYTIWVLQLGAAILINPYHAVMSFGLFVVTLVRTRALRAIAVWIPLGFISLGAAAWLAGYFSDASKVHMPGFELAGTNVLMMIVPMKSTLFGDADGLANVLATQFQYEGWAYLGFGVLVLVGWSLASSRVLVGAIKHHRLLFAFVVATWLLSLSNNIYFGSHLIVGYDLPDVLHWIPDQFRAPGRFVWVPMYAIVIYVLHLAMTRFASGWKLAVLPVLAAVQLIDVRATWELPLASTDHGPREDVIGVDRWRPFVLAHDQVRVLPSFVCTLDGTLHLDWVSAEIEFLASLRALPINGVYSARPARDCAVDQLAWRALKVEPNTLYVVLPTAARMAARLEGLGAACGSFEYGRACTTNAAALADAIRAGTLTRSPPLAPALALGQHIMFSDANSAPYMFDGWSFAEPAGRWSNGEDSTIYFHLAQPPTAGVKLKLRATAALCGKRGSEDVDVTLRGQMIGTLHLDYASNSIDTIRELAIPNLDVLGGEVTVLELHPRDFRTPSQLGCNDDPRQLAVSVKELWLESP